MSRYRKVDPRMWGDAKFRRLSQDAKFLWLYLLTGPETTSLPGLLVGGRAHFAEALNWDVDKLEDAFCEIEREGLAEGDWEARVVWVKNAVKYNPPSSPNAILGWKDHFDSVPECQLKTTAFEALASFVATMSKGFHDTWRDTWRHTCLDACRQVSPIQEQEQEQKQEQKQERERRSPKGDRRVTKRKISLPGDWAPNTNHYTLAKMAGRNQLWVNREADKMRDWAESKGETCISWDARFRNWIRRGLEVRADRGYIDSAVSEPQEFKPPPQKPFVGGEFLKEQLDKLDSQALFDWVPTDAEDET